jgi:hypothetical protein
MVCSKGEKKMTLRQLLKIDSKINATQFDQSGTLNIRKGEFFYVL